MGKVMPDRLSPIVRLRVLLRELYHGQTRRAVRFRLAVIVVDFAIIAFFVVAPFMRETNAFWVIDYVIAALLAADLAARGLAWRGKGR